MRKINILIVIMFFISATVSGNESISCWLYDDNSGIDPSTVSVKIGKKIFLYSDGKYKHDSYKNTKKLYVDVIHMSELKVGDEWYIKARHYSSVELYKIVRVEDPLIFLQYTNSKTVWPYLFDSVKWIMKKDGSE